MSNITITDNNSQQKTIGILGGGQLGKMLCEAATRLGHKTIVYCPKTSERACAEGYANEIIFGEYSDNEQLKLFASKCNLVSFEFENIPVESIRYLEQLVKVYPNSNAIYIAQHRIREKNFFKENNIPTNSFFEVNNSKDIKTAFDTIFNNGLKKAVLKTASFGYDGKGQKVISAGDNYSKTWEELNFPEAILEEFIAFEKEISVVIARDKNGVIEHFPIGENIHIGGILNESILPANIEKITELQAIDIAQKIITKLDYIGVLAVEFFVQKNGEVLVNEIAPRVHNSGHWTMNGCNISQFEQHIRAVSGMELVSPEMTHKNAKMLNLIGEDVLKKDEFTSKSNVFFHDYGKENIKTGRKMAHVNFVG